MSMYSAIWRIQIDYTYPDGSSEQWISDTFHMYEGSYVDYGEAYQDEDGSLVAIFSVWDGIDASAITLEGYQMLHWDTYKSFYPDLISTTGWKDEDGNNWLELRFQRSEDMPAGSYMVSIDPIYDPDGGNPWTDNTTADLWLDD